MRPEQGGQGPGGADFLWTAAELQPYYRRLTVARRRPITPAEIGSVLVRAPNWLGDAIMALPALGLAAELLPEARITVLAAPRVAALYQHRPEVAEVWNYPPRPPGGPWGPWWRTLAGLRRRRFDLALLFPNSFEAALTARLAGIPRRWGYATDGRGWLLTTAIRGHRHVDRLHQVYRHLGLLTALTPAVAPRSPRIYLEAGERRRAAEVLAGGGWRPDQTLIGISPGAAYGAAKQWPPERFAAVAEGLQREYDAHVALLGGPGDAAASRQVAGGMAVPVQDLTGQTDLRLALAVIGHLDLLITNDSGLMHAAAALKTPLVAIFGPTDPVTTGPFTDRAVLVRQAADCAPCLKRQCPSDHRCMTSVTAAAVLEAARFQLRRSQDAPSSLSGSRRHHQ